ncbi:MAG: ABC transporter ATP-binding protein [Thermoguttaceae bacterium]|jgi:putative ABC transport system ATP-binding protein
MLILEARNVDMMYGAGMAQVHALRGINLQVSRGEFLAIMGPSGSGKSTLLHVLGGMVAPTDGQVFFEGADVSTIDDDRRTILRRKRIGFVFQSYNLLPFLTARENVQVPLVLDNIPPSQSRQTADQVLLWVGMDHRRNHLPGELSGGEQQRVAIARALVNAPSILLADEPTGNLDSDNGRQVAYLLRKIVQKRQQSVILVTHDVGIAAYADRIVHLLDGRFADAQLPPGEDSP